MTVSVLYPYLVAIVGISLLAVMWIAVQCAQQRSSFATPYGNPNVARLSGCCGCPGADDCGPPGSVEEADGEEAGNERLVSYSTATSMPASEGEPIGKGGHDAFG